MNSGAFCVERAALKTNRRQFLAQTAAATSLLAAGCSTLREPKSKAQVMTVRGFIPARDMGITLPHEHVMLDFIGAEKAERSRYKRTEVFEAVPAISVLSRPHSSMLFPGARAESRAAA